MIISHLRLRLLCVLALLLMLAGCTTAHPTSVLTVSARHVEAKPGRIGRLTLLRTLELRSDHPSFGGLSGIVISGDDDGKRVRMMAVSDRGHWLEARLALDTNGVLEGIGGWRIRSLRDPQGRPVSANKAGKLFDAEAVARDSDGSLLVAFEQVHRLWRYRPNLDAPAKPVDLPRVVAEAPGNGGLEGITVLADGRLLLISERHENPGGDGSLRGWLGREGRFDPVSYVPSDDFSPTDLATLPNGDVLVLERSYSVARGVRARVRRIPAATLRVGARLEPAEIARLVPPVPVDNFEGIAVRIDGNRTFVYLISDDNFNPLQRTLLLQLRLND